MESFKKKTQKHHFLGQKTPYRNYHSTKGGNQRPCYQDMKSYQNQNEQDRCVFLELAETLKLESPYMLNFL